MNGLNPALVTQRGARRMPRLALLLLCAAYVLPGVLHRDPWRNADLVAFAQMLSIAEGRSSWLAPMLGGLPMDASPLPHGLGALFILALSPFIDGAVAARIPFAILLALVLALVWYTTYNLARTEAAQPLPFAFGGEAEPTAYARALADGGVLALIASLGLLLLGHETTPELAQLFGVSLFLWALAAAPYRTALPRLAALASLLVLATSGAPSMAVFIGIGGTIVCRRSSYAQVKQTAPWVGAATLAGAAAALALGIWRWRATGTMVWDLPLIARQWLWFLWPAWVLAVWTLWRWRHHLLHRHLSVPLVTVGVALAANIAMGGSDRALMLALPGTAVLAAFALPTLNRSASAAVDWFSIFFFSACAIFAWVIYSAMMTGVPAKPAANVAKLAPGFLAPFSPVELLIGVAGTLSWLWLVRWRTGRHREALWKSMVLPAGGVALCWLLAMTLWLPALDYARSSRAWVDRLAAHVPPEACVAGPELSAVAIASLEYFGRWRVDARRGAEHGACPRMVRVVRGRNVLAPTAPAGWALLAEVRRPTERDELTAVYRRAAAP